MDKKGVKILKFVVNMPRQDWMKLFLGRHKSLTTQRENIKWYQAQVNLDTIKEYL